MLSAKITGYLTDCRVTTYDKVLENVVVAADILNLGTTATETATPGATFELSVPNIATTTDVDGMWTLTLPADSVSNILTDGWGLDSDGVAPVDAADSDGFSSNQVIIAGQTSDNEQVTQSVGIIGVCPFQTPDTDVPNTPPQVTSVSDYYGADQLVDGPDAGTVADDNYYTHADPDANATVDDSDTDLTTTDRHYGILKEGVVNDFTINFSEALVDLNEADLVVTLNNEAMPEGTVIVLADDKTSATVTFPEDLEPEDLVDFYLPQWQAVDADGDGVVSEGEDYIDLGLSLDGTTKVGTYVRVSFCIFSRPDHEEASILIGPQIIDADADEDATFAALADYSSSFADNIDGTTALEQLNGQAETAGRLDALAEEILLTTDAGTGTEITVDVNDARIEFSDKAGSVTVVASTGTPGALTGTSGVFEVADTVDGATVTATASNIFGVVQGTASVVTVTDQIAPTTVLQENYGITAALAPKAGIPMVTSSSTTGVTFGNGGEATDGIAAVAGTVGNPIIYVQPRHLVARGSDLTTFTERGNEFDALNEDMDDRLATGETTDVIGIFADRPAYDRQAFAAWDAQSQRIGVSISEEFSVISGAVMGTADISTAITNPTALNGVSIDVDNNNLAADVDLAAINVADVVNLANVDHGGVLSFANVIQDTAGTPNVALPGQGSAGGANAQVVFQDAFPAMVESAEWDGTNFTIVFNEGVAVPTGTDTLDLHVVDARDATGATKTAITLDAGETDDTVEGYFEYNASTFTLVVNVSTGVEALFAGSSTADEEYFYADDIAGSSSEEQHAVLNWDSLEDLNGNSWLEFNGGVLANGLEAGDTDLTDNARYEVNAPVFLAVNTLGQLDVDLDFDNTTYNKRTINAIADSDDAVTLLLTSTYPLDLDATFNAGADASITNLTNAGVAGTTNGLILSGAAIDFLLVEGDFTIDTAASTGLVSKDRMTISFNIVVQNAATGAATDYIEAADTVTINNTALDVANQATDTLGRNDAIQQLIFN
jgi:hypothetical protein